MQNTFRLYSNDFKDGDKMPQKFTADGDDTNPSLNWENPPQGTKSFALIVEDPDAPKGTFIHWCIKNIPLNANSIDKNASVGEEIMNSFQKKGYGGPSPPSGTHRYYFKLYALGIERMKAETVKDFYKEVFKNKIAIATYLAIYSREKQNA
jgi:Raf kinase inhibitor-like YbhB/YbcL family protein